MKHLIGMTDFVLEQDNIKNDFVDYKRKVINYANFLKQKQQKWMFFPCDEHGNVLEEPHREDYDMYDDTVFLIDMKKHQQVKEICIFNNNLLSLIEIKELITQGKTIEFLINYHYEKTGSYLETNREIF